MPSAPQRPAAQRAPPPSARSFARGPRDREPRGRLLCLLPRSRQFPGVSRPDTSSLQHVRERTNDYCGRGRGYRVAYLPSDPGIHRPRLKPARANAAVLENETVWEPLQPGFLPVTQPPRLSVVIAVSAPATPGDNGVGRLV